MIYYVGQKAGSLNIGTRENPFSTISQAAQAAYPGDTVLIGEGIYREWVSPPRSGAGEEARITYANVPGTHPVLSGAETVAEWTCEGEGVYKATLPRALFGAFCPFETALAGDWYDDFGQIHHTGEVFADGKALYEAASLESIAARDRDSWYAACDSETVTIWVWMRGADPSAHTMEVSVRPFVFFPEQEGIGYITVSGLTIENAATQWAPPTAFQPGAIGPHWSRGWIIENCTVRNSKCAGISLGKRREASDNRWTRDPAKGGAQTYTEVIFTNLHRDWARENVGGHIVRGNVICDCGQAGIVGCMGGAFSTIENNHIRSINDRGEFGGAEMAGIKLHAAIDVVVRNNVIHDCVRGLWLDWEAQGARVTRNVIFGSIKQDLFIEVCHGPITVDHNLLLSKASILNVSQGTAFAHNLIAGETIATPETNRFTMYHFPHETAILGSILVYGGDDKVYNNLYIGDAQTGNAVYDPYNDADYRPDTSKDDRPIGTHGNTLGTWVGANAYLGGARPCRHETGAWVDETARAVCCAACADGEYYLEISLPEALFAWNCPLLDTQTLGVSFESGAAYENRDGTPLTLDTDILGRSRRGANPPGPFAQPVPRVLPLCGVNTPPKG